MRYYVITSADGHDWLVRASSALAALERWDEEYIRIERLGGDRARAGYLREQGQELEGPAE